jgi:hypothetical protein
MVDAGVDALPDRSWPNVSASGRPCQPWCAMRVVLFGCLWCVRRNAASQHADEDLLSNACRGGCRMLPKKPSVNIDQG